MDILQAIKERHSVRSYNDKPIGEDVKGRLQTVIDACNAESGLNVQLVTNEPRAFGSWLAHYGTFRGVSNYIVVAGAKGTDEKCGYYGEKVVLEAQMLGLNTCWVGMTYKKVKGSYALRDGEKVHLVIALGYGTTQGEGHKIKRFEDVASAEDGRAEMPDWFKEGVATALLAPTAVNQQKFHFTLCCDGKVKADTRWGFFSQVDLGIAKLHFEIGSGKGRDVWR